MASPLETMQTGEADADDIEVWMKQNGHNLQSDTYEKLKSAGLDTVARFKNVAASEIRSVAQEIGIANIGDQFALKRAREAMGNEKFFVDPQEVAILKSLNDKVREFEDRVKDLNTTEEYIQSLQQRVEHDINAAFKTLSDALNARKATLLQQLASKTSKNQQKLKTRQNDMNAALDSIRKYQNDASNLINSAIALNELQERKAKIEQKEKQIISVIEENSQRYAVPIQVNIDFLMETKTALQFVNSLGVLSDIGVPVLQSLQYDHEKPDGVLKIVWKMDGVDFNEDAVNRKMRIEYALKAEADNQKEQEWKHNDIDIESKQSEGVGSMQITSSGEYTVRLKHFDGMRWSSPSNMKSIAIAQVLPVLSWNTDPNTHGSASHVQIINATTVKCNWAVVVVDHVIKAEEVDTFCFEFTFTEATHGTFDPCFGFISHPQNISNLNQSLYYSGYGVYCDYSRKLQIYINGAKQSAVTNQLNTSPIKKNDRIGFRVNMEQKTGELFYNGSNLGVVFSDLPNAIIPAVSGTGYSGWTTITVRSLMY